MRSTEVRLAKIEREHDLQTGSGERAVLRAWSAAGGPVSLVHGQTDEEFETRVAVLRDTGAISKMDRIARMPTLPPSGQVFVRAHLWHDFTDAERAKLRQALQSPSLQAA